MWERTGAADSGKSTPLRCINLPECPSSGGIFGAPKKPETAAFLSRFRG